MRYRNRSQSTTPTQEVEAPRGVYRLMSMTGANLKEALYCWKTASEDLYDALQIYVERIYPQNQAPQSTPVPCLEDEDSEASGEGAQNVQNFIKRFFGPGMYFFKGVIVATVLLIAIEGSKRSKRHSKSEL